MYPALKAVIPIGYKCGGSGVQFTLREYIFKLNCNQIMYCNTRLVIVSKDKYLPHVSSEDYLIAVSKNLVQL